MDTREVFPLARLFRTALSDATVVIKTYGKERQEKHYRQIILPGGRVGEGLWTTAMRLSSLVCSILMASFASES